MSPSCRRTTDLHGLLRNSAFAVVLSRELVGRGEGKYEYCSWPPPVASSDAVRSWNWTSRLSF